MLEKLHISQQPFVFSAKLLRMIAFRTDGIPSWSIMAFTSLSHLIVKLMKYGFPGFRIFQMTTDYHSNYYPKLSWFLFCFLSVSRRTWVSELQINRIAAISWNVFTILPLVLFPSLLGYHSAIQLILIKLYIVSLQDTTFASTCLEFIIFLRFTLQFSLIPTNPSQLHGK